MVRIMWCHDTPPIRCTPMVSTMDAAMTYQPIFRRVFLALLVLPAGLVGQEAGTSERLLEVGNVEREYVLHLPQGYKKSQKKTFPLVVMLHGLMGTGTTWTRRWCGLERPTRQSTRPSS